MTIKYIGSKRTLVPVLGEIATALGARTAVDMFTGTTRVAQEYKRRGLRVTANDSAIYSRIMADTYIGTDADEIDMDELRETLAILSSLPGRAGYFTKTFCEEARYFQPKNGARIDAIRTVIERDYRDSPLYPILLTSLMLAADRVDSTAGVQMAYLKQWAPRAYNDLELRVPGLLRGEGVASQADATELVDDLPPTDLMYLDPPYNQHRYFTNYHCWVTLMEWDDPEPYGIAMKRIDSRDERTKSVFNAKREMPAALSGLIRRANAETLIVSYNDESWITAQQMMDTLQSAGYEDVRQVGFDFKRYVGAQIGIYNPSGHKVGEVSHLRNTEYFFIAGGTEKVEAATAVATQHSERKARVTALY